MTLITAIVAGLACGYLLGFRPKGVAVFVPVWLLILVIQTVWTVDDKNTPPEDWVYVPVQIIIFGVGLALTLAGSKIRIRMDRRSKWKVASG